jgi:hypothetical protein
MNPNQPQLRDIHPPIALPAEPNYLLIAALILGLLIVVIAIVWFVRRHKKAIAVPLASETALADLMRARRIMDLDQSVQYATEISNILRRYVEKRFQIRSTRQTSTEFFHWLTSDPAGTGPLFSKEHRTALTECLNRCDMAKFARLSPGISDMDKMELALSDFIEDTREKQQGGR